MKIILTGASGLLGSHILDLCLKKNIDVSAMVRNLNPKSYLFQIKDKVKIIEKDLMDSNFEFASIVNDGDTIIHAASLVSPFSKDNEKIMQFNLERSKELFLSANKKENIKWVQISSIATLSNGGHETVDETFHGQYRETPYAKSKYLFDCWLKKNNRKKIPVLTIYPCYMLGKWDLRPSSGGIILAYQFKKINSFLNNTKNFVAASDVANGIILALQKSIEGDFILGGDNIKLSTFFMTLKNILNKEFLPNETNLLSLESDNSLSQDEVSMIKEFSLSNPVDHSKAKNIFGYQPKCTFKESLLELVEYLSDRKLVRFKQIEETGFNLLKEKPVEKIQRI